MRTLCCDVGSAGIRVAIFEFKSDNKLIAQPIVVATRPLKIYNPEKDFYEQKTQEIWSAFCDAASECLHSLPLDQDDQQLQVNSIGFTATCSLVIVEANHDNHCDVIMWMDHRAKTEAEQINRSCSPVLNQFGGTCSPEFSLAKLLWIQRNDPKRFDEAQAFMELPDWLTYRCSQSMNRPETFPRSLCSVVCKWGYDAVHNEWPKDLFEHLGINLESIRHKIGDHIIKPGLPIGFLSQQVAREIGMKLKNSSLVNSIIISSSLIDAHAGALSMLIFSRFDWNESNDPFENALCMISGTSSCHMIFNRISTSTKGVWGPYRDAVLPGYYLREAGQSATGKLIEHVINSYLQNEKFCNFTDIVENLNRKLRQKDFNHQTGLVVNPTFHGNRSPIAESRLKGAIYGMTLDHYSLEDIYVATVEAIAYETKFIVEEIEKNSKPIEKFIVSGGLTKNDFYLQIHADILGKELFCYEIVNADHMLAGAAMIANISSQAWNISADCHEENLPTILNRIQTSPTKSRVIHPRKEYSQYHQKKYKCYRTLIDCCVKIENILADKS